MTIDYGRIRGFNYQPSYAGSLQMIWTHFDRDVWEREVAWSRRFGTNMLHVWLDWHAWVAVADNMFDALEQALEVLASNDIRMMPVLFNRWNDSALPMGMVADPGYNERWIRFSEIRALCTGSTRSFRGRRSRRHLGPVQRTAGTTPRCRPEFPGGRVAFMCRRLGPSNGWSEGMTSFVTLE